MYRKFCLCITLLFFIVSCQSSLSENKKIPNKKNKIIEQTKQTEEKFISSDLLDKDKNVIRIVSWNLKFFFDDDSSNNDVGGNVYRSVRHQKQPSHRKYIRKIKYIIKVMQKLDADIYALQEVEEAKPGEDISKPLKKLTDELNLSVQNKPEYTGYNIPLPEKDRLEINCAFISRIPVTKIDSRFRFMERLDNKFGKYDLHRHIFGVFKLNGLTFNILNVHFPRPDQDEIYKYNTLLKKVHNLIAFYGSKGYDSILLGDFNLIADNINVKKCVDLLQGKYTRYTKDDLTDIFSLKHTVVAPTHERGSKVDRIFISKSLIKSYKNKGFCYIKGGSLKNYLNKNLNFDINRVSDHYPVFADFKLIN